jgi:DNA-binding protein HU-beta
MDKNEFIGRVSEKTGLEERDASKAVDAFLDSVTEALRGGDAVTFTGFGKFSVAHREARGGMKPKPSVGEKVQVAAANVPKFSAGSHLKAAIKQSDSSVDVDFDAEGDAIAVGEEQQKRPQRVKQEGARDLAPRTLAAELRTIAAELEEQQELFQKRVQDPLSALRRAAAAAS